MRGGPVQGGDIAVAVQISLEEAAHGKQVEVAYDARTRCHTCHGNGAKPGTPIETCPRCNGSGQLQAVSRTAFGQLVRSAICDACGGDGRLPRDPCEDCGGDGMVVERRRVEVGVPAGIADGQRIHVSARGHAGERGGPNGDLYVVVRVAEDERFLRDGGDLITVIDVPAPLAALGTTVQVPSLDGPIPVEVKAGTQPGETITLGGRGMPPVDRGRTGDLRVVVNVTIPRRLTAEQRDMLERFADSLTEDDARADEGGHDRQAAAGPRRLIRLAIRVRADRAELLALADLLPILAAGAEERAVDGDVEYSVYLDEPPPIERIRALTGVLDVRTEPVAEGWETRWHEFLRPVRVGELVVRPPWIEGDPGDVVIDPGVYFGAGTHATTRLCLRLLLDEQPGGALCDWGAGTGVLAIAAARLGWNPVAAVEIDPEAIEVIRANAARNGVAVEAVAGDLPMEAPTVVANLPKPALLKGARPLTRLIASGFLAGEADEVVAAFGMREVRRLEEDGWGSVVLG